jgi:hypothetical protein
MRTILLILLFGSVSLAQRLPHFEDFAAKTIFTGKPAKLNLSKYHFSASFNAALQKGANAGPNFADHFTIIQMPEPSACYSFGIADAKTGEFYIFPGVFGGNLVVRRDSRLLITEALDSATVSRIGNKRPSYDWTRFYKWMSNHLIQIDSSQQPIDFPFEPLINIVLPEKTSVEKKAAHISSKHFQQLQWLVGQWCESSKDFRYSLFYRISYVNESQIEFAQFRDSTFNDQVDIALISLDKNRVLLTSGESRWISTGLDSNHVSFIALNSTDSRPSIMTFDHSKKGRSWKKTFISWDDVTGKRTETVSVAIPIK